MKKYLALFCVVILAMLCGCSGSNDKKEKESATTTSIEEKYRTDKPSGNSSNTSSGKNESTTASPSPTKVKVTIPEGFTIYKIAMRLEANNVCKASDFINELLNTDYSSYSQIAAMSSPSDRLFKLEGYLPPATYDFTTEQSAKSVVDTFLKHGASLGTYNNSSDLILASIIEKECGKAEELSNVSSVLHNRLNSGMKLQCDVTVKYIEAYYAEDILKPAFNGNKDKFASLYNTYKCSALPAGPICNPGSAAIKAAQNPASTNYYYFFTDENNNYIYSTTYEEHQANMKKYGVKENTFQSK